jgi:hypothetical protein
MMRLVFVADEFKLRMPVQQLLDRFLMGYPHESSFYKPECEVVLITPEKNSEIERRMKDFGLKWQKDEASGDGIMIFNGSRGHSPSERSFAYGASRSRDGIAGTAVRGAWLLPEIAIARDTRLARGLLIVQGEYPQAEIEALDALLPLVWRDGAKVHNVISLGRENFWKALKEDFWPLVRSAISRSDTPQGDAVRDGRTQDLVGLGLLPGLVKSPRGWLIEHADGFQCVIAVMDGAVADYNVAVQTRAGGIVSAQVYRPPAPMEHHYSRLAALLENYFRTGVPPWPVEQNVFTAQLLQRFEALRRA